MKARVKITFILLFVAFYFGVAAQERSAFFLELIPMQKEVIASLTGYKAIKDTILLAERSTPKERRLAANYLSEYLMKIGWKLEVHHYKITNGNLFLDLFFPPMRGINVAAILPATHQSTSYVLFGAHYDSERGSPGAIDNATGVTLSMGVAYKLAQLKERHINYIVVFFDQEEDNEIGSKTYAKMLKESGRKIHSVHTIDMVGWDNNENKSLELELPSPYLEKLYKNVAQKFNIPVYVTNVSSSDHKSFIDQGFNALGISEEYAKGDTTPYYHTAKDTYNTVNFDYLASSTQFIYTVLSTISEKK